MNRIINGIAKMKKQIDTRLASGLTTQAQVDALHKTLDMDFEEHFRFQNLKSEVIGTKLTMEEGQTLYACLGLTVDHFNRQSIEVKSILTQVFQELLGSKIAARTG